MTKDTVQYPQFQKKYIKRMNSYQNECELLQSLLSKKRKKRIETITNKHGAIQSDILSNDRTATK